MSRWAAVLAGGSGTRFWPLSTRNTPKQMLPLVGAEPLLKQAVSRLDPLIPAERILVVTGEALRQDTCRLLPHIPEDNVLGEPRPASTGPALTWATARAAQSDSQAVVLSLHADWFVGDDASFRDAASRALDVAENLDLLVTVGIVPNRPEVGYGYIEPGEPLGEYARRIKQFTEKPGLDRAQELIEGGALWNSGMFAWTAQRFMAETRALAPEISVGLSMLDDDDVHGFFESVTPIAVDISHYERTTQSAVVAGDFPWDDVGTWSALARVRPQDKSGNVLVGDVEQREATGCVAWADDGPLILDGVDDLVVIRANGITLVTTRERAVHLKDLLATLPERFSGVDDTKD